MIKDVARRHAEVVGVGCCQILEMATDLVDELKPDLIDCIAAAHCQLVAAIRQAQPVEALGARVERAARVCDHAALLVGRRAQRARVED